MQKVNPFFEAWKLMQLNKTMSISGALAFLNTKVPGCGKAYTHCIRLMNAGRTNQVGRQVHYTHMSVWLFDHCPAAKIFRHTSSITDWFAAVRAHERDWMAHLADEFNAGRIKL